MHRPLLPGTTANEGENLGMANVTKAKLLAEIDRLIQGGNVVIDGAPYDANQVTVALPGGTIRRRRQREW
jgi:hypothetical protein